MKNRVLGSLTFEEISRLGERSVLVLPLGSMEQHGPHLPLDTDAILAERLAEAITTRFGDTFDLWRLPTLPIGLSREHAWAAGTLSLSITGMTAFLRELAREIARALPARNLMIVNGHGGNRGILEVLGYELKDDFGLNLCALHTGALMSPVPAAGLPEIHAGKDETSLMLALAPDRVRREHIASATRAVSDADVRTTILDSGVSWPWSSGDPRIADRGVIGDVSGASAEHGRIILDRILDAAGAALQRLRSNQELARTS
ncbi:creatininase family protein [Reyranella sp.]|uniref:creatininase family protein n=1 Tax=Reyranella sp. TaxID=1929291 RepID=UPI003784EB20